MSGFSYNQFLEDTKQYLPNDITNGKQLDKVCRVFFPNNLERSSNALKNSDNQNPSRGYYMGIFSSDNVPNFKEFTSPSNIYTIVNTDIQLGTGEHWVAVVYITDSGSEPFIIGYDSYGRDIKTLLPSLTENNDCPILNTENDPEQGIEDDLSKNKIESNCGSRSVAWLLTLHYKGITDALLV